MNCPKCTSRALAPIATAAPSTGAGARAAPKRCGGCGGLWISRRAVPALHDSGVLESLEVDPEASRRADKRNGLCPEGHGIMARARVRWDDPYFVEKCSACDGIWLDAGEWSRLGSDLLIDHLDELWLPSWRRRLQDDHERAQLETDLKARLGDELFQRTHDFGMTLAAHEHGDVALAYVRELVRRHRSRVKGSG